MSRSKARALWYVKIFKSGHHLPLVTWSTLLYLLEGLLLKLKLQYFGHLMWRADSWEKILMMGKIEGRRRRGWQRMRWLGGITVSMDIEFEQTPGDGGQGSPACCSPQGHQESDLTERLKTTTRIRCSSPRSHVWDEDWSLVVYAAVKPRNLDRGSKKVSQGWESVLPKELPLYATGTYSCWGPTRGRSTHTSELSTPGVRQLGCLYASFCHLLFEGCLKGHWFSSISGLPCCIQGQLGEQRKSSVREDISLVCPERQGLSKWGWHPIRWWWWQWVLSLGWVLAFQLVLSLFEPCVWCWGGTDD